MIITLKYINNKLKVKIMKPIKLSKEQKIKLLKMCKILFPEYYFQIIQDFIGFSITSLKDDERMDIHWFEFCMTHLVDNLSLTFAKKEGEDDKCLKEEFLFELNDIKTSVHPIDYLYKQFKNLKL